MNSALSKIFTDQGSSDSSLPELLKGLGSQYKFLLFKNAAAELQLAHHSGKLRFRLKKATGEILYTSYVSNVAKILDQVTSFLSGGETFQENFVFSASPKEVLFDFEQAEKAARREAELAVRAAQRRQRLLLFGRALAGAMAVLLIAGFAYVKNFSHVTLSPNLLESEPTVRVIYSLEQVRDAFQGALLIDPMREAREQGLDLSNKLFSAEERINELSKSKSAERSRLSNLANDQLIKEFPNETKTLAEVPADEAPVVKGRQPAPGLNTKNLASALGISYSEALRLKWDLDTPAQTVVSPGVSHAEERAKARASAIDAIMARFEDERPLKVQADNLHQRLAKNQETRTALQRQALEKIKNLGIAKPTGSWFQVKRKPCLLIFEEHGLIFELPGNQFQVELALNGQGQHLFLDYLLATSTLNK